MADSLNDALHAWRSHEAQYEKVRAAVDAFASDAALIGVQMIQDVPTRVEYMRMIRAEADDMLAYARANRETVRLVFDRIYERRS